MKKNYILVFILISVFYGLVWAAPRDSAKPLRIGYSDYLPFYFKGASGFPRGILVDFWNLWSEKTGVPIEFVTLTWEESIAFVDEGKIDINAALFYTKERDEYLDFSKSFFDLPVGLFYRKYGPPLSGIEDLAGRRVGVVAEDFHAQYIRKRQPEAMITEYIGYEALVQGAINGEIDAFIMETPVAMTYLAKLGGIDKIVKAKNPVRADSLRAAVKEGEFILLNIVDDGISSITPEEMDEIVSGWTGEPRREKETVEALDLQRFDKVVIANSIDSIPFHFVDSNGDPKGMLVDLWRIWSEKTGVGIEFKSGDFGRTLEFVRDGQADIQAGLFYSEARDRYLDYTQPLCSLSTHFFFHNSIYGLRTIDDLIGFKIGVIKGDYALEFLEKELPGAALAIYSNNHALFDAVERGEVRVFVKDTPIALSFLARKNLLREYRYHPERPLYSKDFHAAVKEGDIALRDLINNGLMMISPKERADLERRWTGASSFKTEDVLVIACSKGYPPFTFLNTDGEPAGLFVDIWRLWAEKTQNEIEFRITTWDETIQALKDGTADIHSGLFRTEERRRWLAFSQPVYQTSSNLFYHASRKNVEGVKDFTGQKVGVLRGGYADSFLKENWPDIDRVQFDTSESAVHAAVVGKIAGFLDETPSILNLFTRLGLPGEFHYLREPLYSKKVFAAVRKDHQELLKIVDSGLQAVSSEELAHIESRWIPNPSVRYFQKGVREIALTAEEESWISRHETIRLFVRDNLPPIQYFDDSGAFMGIASEYVSILNEKLGLNMRVETSVPPHELISGAGDRKIDVLACEPQAGAINAYMTFSNPYISFPYVIVTHSQAPFVGGLPDLYGKRAVAVEGQYAHQKLMRDHPDITIETSETALDGLRMLSSNKAAAYVGNLAVVSYLIQKEGLTHLKIAAPTEYGDPGLCFAVRNDWPELVRIIDKGLNSISAKEHSQIRRKWISVRYEYGVDTAYIKKAAVYTGIVMLIVLGTALIWNFQIRRREDRFRGLTENAVDITQAITKEGVVLYQSPSHERILGYKKKELVGTSIVDLMPEEEAPGWRSTMDSLLAGGGMQTLEHGFIHKSGEYRYFESRYVDLLENKALKAVVVNAHDITERKKAEEALKATNRKIMESIRYAKMIQYSMMPSISDVKTCLPDSFLAWKPRDVVGGDIVFFDAFGRSVVIAVMDCTGHGVPGALMTMIVSSGIRRIVKDEGCRDPSAILKKLNFIVKTTLQQNTRFAMSDDGLEAAVVCISSPVAGGIPPPTSKTPGTRCVVNYAGARLPLYYVRNGEVFTIKGDKQRLGYRKSDLAHNFTGHNIIVDKETCFYMATDGFIDQLGGVRELRFGSDRFRSLILKISPEEFDAQEQILFDSFYAHKSNHERQDDITVFGFRI